MIINLVVYLLSKVKYIWLWLSHKNSWESLLCIPILFPWEVWVFEPKNFSKKIVLKESMDFSFLLPKYTSR